MDHERSCEGAFVEDTKSERGRGDAALAGKLDQAVASANATDPLGLVDALQAKLDAGLAASRASGTDRRALEQVRSAQEQIGNLRQLAKQASGS